MLPVCAMSNSHEITGRIELTQGLDQKAMLRLATEKAQQGMAVGGIPVSVALFDREGRLLGRSHYRRVQHGDPSAHGEKAKFINFGEVPLMHCSLRGQCHRKFAQKSL